MLIERGPTALGDQGLYQSDPPAGLVAPKVVRTAADRDQHSGGFACVARNLIHLLVDTLAALYGGAGRVTQPGCYDGIHDRCLWQLQDHVAELLETGPVQLSDRPARVIS